MVFIFLKQYRTGSRDLKALSGKWRDNVFYDVFMVKWFFSSAAFIFFIIFIVFSLVGFKGEEYPVSYEASGTDIVFAVDISKSMLCKDIAPSRLKRTSSIIQGFIEEIPDGRLGIVVFKGEGIKIIPLTEDIEAISLFLGGISTDLLTARGSDIESGLETSVNSFPSEEERRRIIFLFSDGEALSGNFEKAAFHAKAEDITVFTIGAGTDEGAYIPLADGSLINDNTGKPVVSRLNKETLEKIAQITDGKMFMLQDPMILNKMVDSAVKESLSGVIEGFKFEEKDNYRIFLFLAIISLLIYRGVKIVIWKDTF